MQENILTVLPNLGVGVAAVLVLFLTFKVFINALNEREKAFREYANENNHKTVEVLVEAKNHIKESSEFMKQATQVLKSVLEHLIKGK